jgi:glycosyltransferase involved in cell wall biosynthesis
MQSNNKHPHISVVTPAYKCSGCILELYNRLVATLGMITDNYEIIFVDDCSPESDWDVISGLCIKDSKVKGIRLSRNFGQHYAITAGLDHAFGEWVVVMDCDLQDQPEEITPLYNKAVEGFDIVLARRGVRTDSTYRKLSSYIFSVIYSYLGDIKADPSVANFSISSQTVINEVRRFRERSRSFPIFLQEVGFKKAFVNVEHSRRFAGESSYTFAKLFDFALETIIAQSNKPLRLSIRIGFSFAFLSFLYGCVILYRYHFNQIGVSGWTTLALLICFLAGLGFANLGIVGLYLGKVFDELKKRPLYIIGETKNIE